MRGSSREKRPLARSMFPHRTDEVVVDVETIGVHPDDLGAECRLIATFDGDVSRVTKPLVHTSNWGWTKHNVSGRKLVGHNLKFDLHFLQPYFKKDLSRWVVWDTLLASRILEPLRLDHGLKSLSESKWGPEATKFDKELAAWLKENKLKKKDLLQAPRGLVRAYALEDATNTWKLWRWQMDLIEQDGMWDELKLIEREVEFMKVLYRMERRGLGWDSKAAKRVARQLSKEIKRRENTLPFKPTGPAAKEWFYVTQGFVPPSMTDKGSPSLDKTARAKLIKQGVPLAKEWDEYCYLKTARGMWYEGWTQKVGPDGRLRTVFSQAEVVSGRLSSGRVNLQAIPHDYRLKLPQGTPTPRELIRAREGFELWEFDVNQAEIRIAAAVARCKEMLLILESGQDLHDTVCKELFGVEKESADWFKFRQVTIRLDFAAIYSVGARGFKEQLEIHAGLELPEAECRTYLERFRERFPEFVRVNRVAEERAAARGWVKLCSGRKRWFTADERYHLHKAFNQVVQGGVAEAMKDAMLVVEQKWPKLLLLQIHDSLVTETRQGWEGVQQVEAAIVREFEKYWPVQFKVEGKKWGS